MLSHTQIALLAYQARSCLQMGPLAAAGGFRTCRGSRCVLLGLTSMGVGNSSGTSSLLSSSCGVLNSHFVSARFVQFEQTSETIGGINKRKKGMSSRWITKSTKDYMSEADSKVRGAVSVVSQEREDLKVASAKRKERFREIADETDRIFDLELDRLRDDRSRRIKKGWNFFKRQGKAFTLLYIVAYVGTLTLLYVGFASGYLKKEIMYELMCVLFGSFLNRDKFYDRVQAWDTYINFGFAFVVNELLEVVRLPMVMLLFFQFRPYITGVNTKVKASIFRFRAAES